MKGDQGFGKREWTLSKRLPDPTGEVILQMTRLSRVSVIRDIELLAKNREWRPGRREWSALGVHCWIERHSYSARAYSFDLEIFGVDSDSRSDRRWSVIIVTEFWRNSAAESIHAPKWLKLVKGKPNDVLRWISANRDGLVKAS